MPPVERKTRGIGSAMAQTTSFDVGACNAAGDVNIEVPRPPTGVLIGRDSPAAALLGDRGTLIGRAEGPVCQCGCCEEPGEDQAQSQNFFHGFAPFTLLVIHHRRMSVESPKGVLTF